MLSTPCVTVPGLRPLSNFFWIPLNFRVKFWIWFYILHCIYIVYGKPCVVVQRPNSLLELPKLPAQLLTFYHSCFAPTQGGSWEKRAWCDFIKRLTCGREWRLTEDEWHWAGRWKEELRTAPCDACLSSGSPHWGWILEVQPRKRKFPPNLSLYWQR